MYLIINSLYIVLGQSKFIKKKMNSLAIKVLSPDQHQVLDVTKCFVTSKNWCQLADKTLMAREFVYFLMNLDCPRTIYKEFIIRYLWTKIFYQYIFQYAVMCQTLYNFEASKGRKISFDLASAFHSYRKGHHYYLPKASIIVYRSAVKLCNVTIV